MREMRKREKTFKTEGQRDRDKEILNKELKRKEKSEKRKEKRERIVQLRLGMIGRR
jgi:hypothetical protein